MKLSSISLLLMATFAVSGCGLGEDSVEPGNDERLAASALQDSLRRTCPSGVRFLLAVDHTSDGRTSGFIFVCADGGAVRAVGHEGGKPGKEERRDTRVLQRALPSACHGSGVRAVTATQRDSSGRTSGFEVLCEDGRVTPLGR